MGCCSSWLLLFLVALPLGGGEHLVFKEPDSPFRGTPGRETDVQWCWTGSMVGAAWQSCGMACHPCTRHTWDRRGRDGTGIEDWPCPRHWVKVLYLGVLRSGRFLSLLTGSKSNSHDSVQTPKDSAFLVHNT